MMSRYFRGIATFRGLATFGTYQQPQSFDGTFGGRLYFRTFKTLGRKKGRICFSYQ